MSERTDLFGVLGEFDTPEALLSAARQAYDAGYRRLDAYSPFPIEGLSEAIGFRHTRLPALVLIGGLVGCVGGFLLQYYTSVHAYPLDVGGRPLNSWPSFIVVTFELTILVAALFAVLGMFALNGLPTPHHPLFGAKRFALATRVRFFLCIEAADSSFDVEEVERFLGEVGAREVSKVEGT